MKWDNKIRELSGLLGALEVTDAAGARVDADAAFTEWKQLTASIRDSGNTIFLIGNGASASMASHIAADLEKNFHVRTEVFTDLSRITAIANDMGYEEVFAEPLRRKMVRGDMLVAISSSGMSTNVIAAVRQTVEAGDKVITLTAMSGENTLRSLGALNFHVPAQTFGQAETCHAAILHCWVDMMEE